MPKGNNIKWRDKDLAELQRVVKNFNAKIARVSKNSPHLADFQPSKVSVKDLKSKISSRSDFNRSLNSLKRYSEKGVEQVKTDKSGLSKTKYERKEVSIKFGVYNRAMTAELKKSGISVQAGNMGSIQSAELKHKKRKENQTPKEWDKMVEVLDKRIMSNFKQEQANEYKRRYLLSIKENLGSAGYDLYKYVEGIDAQHLLKHSIMNPILSIDFPYDPYDEESKIEVIMNEWQESYL